MKKEIKNISKKRERSDLLENLKKNLKELYKEKKKIELEEYNKYSLANINTKIRKTNMEIQRIENLIKCEFEKIELKNGKIIHSEERDTIQFIFDKEPNIKIKKLMAFSGLKYQAKDNLWETKFSQSNVENMRILKQKIEEIEDNKEIEME